MKNFSDLKIIFITAAMMASVWTCAAHAGLSVVKDNACKSLKDSGERLACYDAMFAVDPLLNKTITPRAGLGNDFNKFWITPKGRVIWFFVSGKANEGIDAQLNDGPSNGATVLQYEPTGKQVEYGKYKGRVVRVPAPFVATAVSDLKGGLEFSFSFAADHVASDRASIKEAESTSLQVKIENGRCEISGKYATKLTRNGSTLHNISRTIPPDECTVTEGNK